MKASKDPLAQITAGTRECLRKDVPAKLITVYDQHNDPCSFFRVGSTLVVIGYYGTYSYGWSNFDGAFDTFLRGCHADYVTDKLLFGMYGRPDREPRKFTQAKLRGYVALFLAELKKESLVEEPA